MGRPVRASLAMLLAPFAVALCRVPPALQADGRRSEADEVDGNINGKFQKRPGPARDAIEMRALGSPWSGQGGPCLLKLRST